MEEKKQYSEESTDEHHHPKVWDCRSTLYDSLELNSFKCQWDISMPHNPDRQFDIVPPPPPISPKKFSKISRSLNRFVKSVFSKSNKQDRSLEDRYYFVWDKSGALATIPEVPEVDYGGFLLEMEYSSTVKNTASDRFEAAPIIGISRA